MIQIHLHDKEADFGFDGLLVATQKTLTMVVTIKQPDELMARGLELVSINRAQQQRVLRSRNVSLFKAHFGSDAQVYSALWLSLQVTSIDEARITDATDKDFDYFFMTL